MTTWFMLCLFNSCITIVLLFWLLNHIIQFAYIWIFKVFMLYFSLSNIWLNFPDQIWFTNLNIQIRWISQHWINHLLYVDLCGSSDFRNFLSYCPVLIHTLQKCWTLTPFVLSFKINVLVFQKWVRVQQHLSSHLGTNSILVLTLF